MTYALDTNIISYALNNDAYIKEKLLAATQHDDKLIIPPIVYYEIKRWLLESGATAKRAMFEKLLMKIPVGDFDVPLWDVAAEIWVRSRKKGKPNDDDADILIAAFCVSNGYVLVTNNTRHFEDVDGLKLVDWKK
jgi:predicted nucleic acid-binding protein